MAIADDALDRLPPVPLSKLAPRVRNGDLLLCSGRDVFSRLIAASTHSPWTHVAIAFRWPSIGRIMVFESVERIGVRVVPLATFIARDSGGKSPYPGRILLARHALMAERLGKGASAAAVRMTDFAVDRLGDRFAAWELARIGLRLMLGAANVRLPRSLGPRNEFICSEYVGRCMEALDIQIPWDGLGFIAPADFARAPEIRAIAQIRTR